MMNAPTKLYAGVRPSDLRYDSHHVLAEYIAQEKEVVATVCKLHEDSKQLVDASLKTAERGLVEFKAAGQHLASQCRSLQSELTAVVQRQGVVLAQGVAKAHAAGAMHIVQAGELASSRLESLTSQLNSASARLETAAARAVAERHSAEQAVACLSAYKLSLQRFETDVMARVQHAKATLQAASVWTRLDYVLRATNPGPHDIKAPNRPAALRAPAKSSARQ